VNAIGALIYKNGNRRVRARIRDMLDHFLHDEGIANDEANHLRSLAARFFAENRAVIQLHKQHQSYCAQAFLNCAFQLGKGTRFISRSPEFGHVRMTDRRVKSRHHLVEGFRGDEAESLNLNCSDHLEDPFWSFPMAKRPVRWF